MSTLSSVEQQPLAYRLLQFAQTSYVIFEATIMNTLVAYWGYDLSPAILISGMVLSICKVVRS